MPLVQPIPITPLRDDPVQDSIWKRYLETLQRSVSTSVSSITASSVVGIIAAVNGGTGFSTYVVGDLFYATTTSTLARLADVATGDVLLSGGVSTTPVYGKVNLQTHITSSLPLNHTPDLLAFAAAYG